PGECQRTGHVCRISDRHTAAQTTHVTHVLRVKGRCFVGRRMRYILMGMRNVALFGLVYIMFVATVLVMSGVVVVTVCMTVDVVMPVLHAMNNRARAEEQERLEEGVRNHVEHRRAVRADADRSDHKTELRDGRVSENALDVELPYRDVARDNRGRCANDRD